MTISYFEVEYVGSLITASDAGATTGSTLSNAARSMEMHVSDTETYLQTSAVGCSVVLPASTGWVQVRPYVRQHADSYPDIVRIWTTDTSDGGVQRDLSWTPLVFAPDETGFVTFYLPRVPSSAAGETFADIEADYGTAIKLWVEFQRIWKDADGFGVGGGGYSESAVSVLECRSEVRPSYTSRLSDEGSETYRARYGLTSPATDPIRSAVFTFTDSASNVDQTVTSYDLRVATDPLLLRPLSPYSVSAVVYYDPWLGQQITHTPTALSDSFTVAANGDAFTATVTGTRVALVHAPAADERAFERSTDNGTTWERVLYTDGHDYPPLNTEVDYRAWSRTGATYRAFATVNNVTVASAGWTLTSHDPDGAVTIDLLAENVAGSRQSTNMAAHNGTTGTAIRGTVEPIVWRVSCTVTTPEARAILETALASAHDLTLRGPHGEHSTVVVVGTVSTDWAHPLTSPGGTSPTTGTALIAEYDFELAEIGS